MENITLPFVIIAIVEQFKSSFPSIHGFYTLLLAICLGAVAGYFKVEGVDMYHGIILGITAVGVHTAVSATKSKETKDTISSIKQYQAPATTSL